MKRIICFFIILLFLSVPALAVETEGVESALPGSAREVLGDLTVGEVLKGADVTGRLWDWVREHAASMAREAGRGALSAMAVTLLCSVAASGEPEGKTPPFVLLGGALAIMGICAGDLHAFLDRTMAALQDMEDFSRALLPCVAAASAASGHGASGAARYTVSAVFLDLLMTLGRDGILPMIYACAAVSTANAALPSGALGGPVKLLTWGCKTLLTALTTVFTLSLTLTGAVSSGADKLAVSATKTAITGVLPVVGKIIADGTETYLMGARLIRSAVGVFGLVAVAAVCIGPVLELGLRYILFKAAACVCEPFAEGRLAELLGNLADCCGMALGLLGSAGAMLFVSVMLGAEVLTT